MLILRESHKSQNERVLLPNFFNKDILASALSKFVVDDCSWDEHEEKHVEEYEDDEEGVVSLRVLDGWGLVVGVVVVASKNIHLHYHLAEVVEIACVLVEPSGMVWKLRVLKSWGVIDHLGAYECEPGYDKSVVSDKDKNILV